MVETVKKTSLGNQEETHILKICFIQTVVFQHQFDWAFWLNQELALNETTPTRTSNKITLTIIPLMITWINLQS